MLMAAAKIKMAENKSPYISNYTYHKLRHKYRKGQL